MIFHLKKSFLFFLLALLFALGVEKAQAAVSPTVTAASMTAQGVGMGAIRIHAKIPQVVKSKDSYYYLFEVNPSDDRLVRVLGKGNKQGDNTHLVFNFSCQDDPAYVVMKYALAVKTSKGSGLKNYTRISPAIYCSYPERATVVATAYKRGATKKGLQSTSIEQLLDSGSKNCFLNLNISTVLSGASSSYYYGGETYHFNPLSGYITLIRECNARGIQVTMQLMLDSASPDNLKAGGLGSGASHYAFNTQDPSMRKWTGAIFSYLAKLFGTDTCYVSNWILGNEVNSAYPYYYMGQVSIEEFAANYAATFRDLYNAVKGYRGSSRVFICLEHCWNIPNQTLLAFPGKTLLSLFDQELRSLEEGIHWDLAYHAYPKDLANPAFWNDGLYDTPDTPTISPINLRTLTRYIQKAYGPDTRIILSEIGFHSGAGDTLQAAGIAMAYYIAACNPMVDAIHMRSYQDEAGDAAHGVSFGMVGHTALKVFRLMDTKDYLTATKNLLKKTVGQSWTALIPGYKASRIYSYYGG